MKRVDAMEATGLIDGGITLVDVLPATVYAQEHLPGARSIPLETFQPADVDDLDRATALLVYCFDQH